MPRSPGRPHVGPRVSVRLTAELLAQLDAEATRRGESRAETIRRLVGGALDDSGVDVAQIRRALARTPAQRIRDVARVERSLAALRGSATR